MAPQLGDPTAEVAVILGVLGALVLAVAVVDVVTTTISLRGGGPLSSRVTSWLWRAGVGRGLGHRVLDWYGALMLPLTAVLWTVLLYGGWTLVFLGDPDSVVVASTGAPVDAGSKVYFTGYVISTLGNGELRPGDGVWQAFTVAAALSGLAAITLALTYVAPVLGAVVQKRQAAQTVSGLGGSAEEILETGWDRDRFAELMAALQSAVAPLTLLAQQHMAYPVLHYFHATDRADALAVQVGVLDDVVTLLRHGVAPEHRPSPLVLGQVDRALQTFLTALEAAHIDPADEPAPVPSLDVLRGAGIPSVDAVEYAAAVDDLGPRRALVAALIKNDGWEPTPAPAPHRQEA